MKTSAALLIASGLVSSAALAQMQTAPQRAAESPAHPAGVAPPASGTNGAQPGAGQSGSGASGTQPESQSSGMQPPSSAGSLGSQSGPQSGMPTHPSSGTSDAASDASSDMPPQPRPDASGAPPPPRGRTEPPPASRLRPKTENGVAYLCGGVGQDEANQLKSEARDHDLMLTFAARNGEYLADVHVAISDANGIPMLQTDCGGPMMLLDLPRGGAYRVHAEAGGHALDRTVNVKPHGQKGHALASAVLVWPAPSASDASGGSGAGEERK